MFVHWQCKQTKAAVLEKSPELAAETISMSDEEFIIFANMYMNSHNDSIASEIALQGVLLAQEEHEIASEAEHKLDAMPMSGKAGFYISAIKDAVKEYGREYLDSPVEHTLDLAEGTAYFAADVSVSGGADIFLGGVVKKAGAKVARALSKASKGLTKRVFDKIVKGINGETARLTNYGGPGGGHHIHSKAAYIGHPNYNFRKAPCLSNQKMTELGIKHKKVTLAQQRLFLEFNQTGKPLTREAMNSIQVQALVEGGASRELARSLVAESQWWFKKQEVRLPVRKPYGRVK